LRAKRHEELDDMSLLRKRNRRKAPERRRFALPELDWRRLGSAAAALGALSALGYLISLGLDQPVRKVTLEGPFQRVSTVEVEQVLRASLHGGFVTADLEGLRKSIEAMAWVDRARVQRRWPDTIVVEVVEQQAAARWGDDGLLNTRGELFVSGARYLPPELPRLDGPQGTEAQVAQRYLAVQGRLLDLGLRLVALRLDPRGAWEMELSNGVTVRLGRSQVDQRTDRFLRVAAQVIAGHAAEIDHVDMRYSNGFSIGWRDAAGPTPNRAAAVPRTEDSDTDV
jgi:cell division protein FtsQ